MFDNKYRFQIISPVIVKAAPLLVKAKETKQHSAQTYGCVCAVNITRHVKNTGKQSRYCAKKEVPDGTEAIIANDPENGYRLIK